MGDHPGRPGADRIFVALYDTPPLPLCRAIRLLASAPSLSAHSPTCPTRALGHTSTPRSTRQVTCLVPFSSRPATHHTPHITPSRILHSPCWDTVWSICVEVVFVLSSWRVHVYIGMWVFGYIGCMWLHGIAIGHTKQNAPDSHPNSEVKLLQARVVLGWGTTREGRVLIAFLCLPTRSFVIRSRGPASCAGRLLRVTPPRLAHASICIYRVRTHAHTYMTPCRGSHDLIRQYGWECVPSFARHGAWHGMAWGIERYS